MPTGLDRARFELTRRSAGDLGGVELPAPFTELKEDFLRSVGVPDREVEPNEVEDGDRRNLAGERGRASYDILSVLEATGDEGGSSVAVAVPTDRRFMVVCSAAAPLFVDLGEGSEPSGGGSWGVSSFMFFVRGAGAVHRCFKQW
jgi:hypothetical protein